MGRPPKLTIEQRVEPFAAVTSKERPLLTLREVLTSTYEYHETKAVSSVYGAHCIPHR